MKLQITILAVVILCPTIAYSQQAESQPLQRSNEELRKLARLLASTEWHTAEARSVVLDVAARLRIPEAGSVLQQFMAKIGDATLLFACSGALKRDHFGCRGRKYRPGGLALPVQEPGQGPQRGLARRRRLTACLSPLSPRLRATPINQVRR